MTGATDSAVDLAARRAGVALCVAVVLVCCLHAGLGGRRIATGVREASEALAHPGTDALAIGSLRAALDDAEELQPRRAWQMRATVRRFEASLREVRQGVRLRLAELDARSADLAARGEFRSALAVYGSDDPALGRAIRTWRAARIAELTRLAENGTVTPP
jgi:hypothetical protein